MSKGDMIWFETPDKKSLSGYFIVIPGFEDLDLISVQNGFEKKIYEHTSGMEITSTTAFSDEEAVSEITNFLLSKGVTSETIFNKIYKAELIRKWTGKSYKFNDSKSYSAYERKKQEENDALENLYDENEIIAIQKLIDIAKAEGLSTSFFEPLIGLKKVNKTLPKTTIKDLDGILYRLREDKEIDRCKKAGIPLSDKHKKHFGETFEDFKAFINCGHKTDMIEKAISKLPAFLQMEAFDGFVKQQQIYNKYGYRVAIPEHADVGTHLICLIGDLNARSEKRKTKVNESIENLKQSIQAINRWHKKELNG